MRFMMLVWADKETEAGTMPSTELIVELGKYLLDYVVSTH